MRRKRISAKRQALAVPVVIVGNISVGGTGKTPVVLALVKSLKAHGLSVGIVSRGYGGNQPSNQALLVSTTTPVAVSGDESRLLADQLDCPVYIGRDRLLVAQELLQQFPATDIIISDDGLQHYALPRQREIVVMDAERGFGNGHCLPAGPLREPVKRLQEVDWLLINNSTDAMPSYARLTDLAPRVSQITLEPRCWQHVVSGKQYPLSPTPWPETNQLQAVAAIGHPERFFTTLADLGLRPQCFAFDDHHPFQVNDFAYCRDSVIVMTTKDAVKCRAFADEQWWALQVEIELPPALISDVLTLVKTSSAP